MNPHREILKELQAEYHRLNQLKRCTHQQNLRDKLDNMITENPNAY